MGPITQGNLCLLCQRKFENPEKLGLFACGCLIVLFADSGERHVTLSDLHKTNYKKKSDEVKQQIAKAKPKPKV